MTVVKSIVGNTSAGRRVKGHRSIDPEPIDPALVRRAGQLETPKGRAVADESVRRVFDPADRLYVQVILIVYRDNDAG